MEIRDITTKQKHDFNNVVPHPLQSFEWGEFRAKTGVKVIRRGFYQNNKLTKGFTLTIHKIPKTPFYIGYLPKGDMPDQDLIDELKRIGKKEKCIFIQLEPNVISDQKKLQITDLVPSAHPLFTKYTFILDLAKTEDELLKNMHSKARYNIKIAKKHNVEITEDNSESAFNSYLKLMKETTTRQRFYAHTEKYHKQMWEALKNAKFKTQNSKPYDELTAHLLIAKYKNKILTTWILFVFRDTLYYPYGASSSEHKEVMANNLIMWEAIRFGKKLGLKKFDMWGSLGPNPDPKDPWFGFHNFKSKYRPSHVEFIGSFDLVISPILYQVFRISDKIRWHYLKLKKK